MRDARAVIIQNVTPMRAEPDARSEQVSQAILGETIRVLRMDGEFAEVQSPDSYQGWIRSRHMSLLETGERYPEPSRAVMVSALYLPVFNEPHGRAERLTLLTLGTAVELAPGDSGAEFYPIRLPGGGVGYVEASALIIPHFPPRENLGPNLAVVARGMIGVPYLWGGRTPFGIDCSGFTQRVFWLCGVTIPRDAHQQAASDLFQAIDLETATTGDLLFFRDEEDRRGMGVTHVGLALDSARFIHASAAQGVATTPLEDPAYRAQLRFARRIRAAAE